MDFEKKLGEYIGSVNEFLKDCAAVPETAQKVLFEAMNYSLMAGGKRIRPVLTLSVCDMLGGDMKDALLFGSAIECIHTYSLIHDDLPCMDDDSLRRGRPTCHIAYGEANALLAGDGLLNTAFELMSDSSRYSSIDFEKAVNIIHIISSASGKYGMIGGQVIDLESENREDISADELMNMHRLKTGAIIRAAALVGAVIGGADSAQTERIAEFSESLGLAFQVKDDILDVSGSEELLGKPIGSDEESGKRTFVSVLGLEKSNEELKRLTEKAKKSLEIFGERAEFLLEFTDYLTNRQN